MNLLTLTTEITMRRPIQRLEPRELCPAPPDPSPVPHPYPAIVESRRAGREFLLRHRLYQEPGGEPIHRSMTLFSFPPRWHYDVLAALDHFRACDAERDERLQDALALLEDKRRKDGTWLLQNRHRGETFFEIEEVGRPSRWNTLRALRVQRWWHERE
jgi:hypothetical protein